MKFVFHILFIGGLLFCQSLHSQIVLINEVLSSPANNPADVSLNATTNANSLYNIDFQPEYNREWIELYNPSGCDTADISCYTLACNMDPGDQITHNWGAFTFPNGTKIPPHGYIIVGGNNSQVPFLDFNMGAYRQSSYGVSNIDGVSNRWFLRDEFGWVAIYDPNSNPVDAVYWNWDGNPSLLYTTSEYLSPITSRTSCTGLRTFPAAVNIPGIEFVGSPIAQSYLSFQRIHDGGSVWWSTPQTPTPRANNYANVTPPTITINSKDDYCNLGIGGIHIHVEYHGSDSLQFQWLTAPFGTNANIDNLHAGTYIVKIFDPYYCNTHYDTITLIDKPKFNVNIVNVAPQICSDPNGHAEATASNGIAPYAYQWNSAPTQNTSVLQNVVAGLYTVNVTDSVGCTLSDTVTIQNQFPLPPVSLALKNDTCDKGVGSAMVINTSGISLSYLWFNNSNGNSISGLHAGNYSLTVSNAQCSKVYNFSITNDYQASANFTPSPEVVFTENPICEFFDNSLQPIRWWWDFGDGSSDIISHPIHRYTSTGNFLVHLIIEDIHGCIDSLSRMVYVKENTVFYIPNAFSPNEDGKNEVFKVEGFNIYDFELRIFSRWGELIYFSTEQEKGWDGKFLGKECPQGVYIWRLQFTKDKEKGNAKKEFMTGNVTLFR